MMRNNKHLLGFTLIELLIVVAIIAILAAIAVPNFLEAQTRSKVSRAKSDLRTYAVGCESYYVDNNKFPICLDPNGVFQYDAMLALVGLSTPVAYLSTSELSDAFESCGRTFPGWNPEYADHYVYAYYLWTGSGSSPKSYPAKTFGDAYQEVPNLNAAAVWTVGPASYHCVPEWALAYYHDNKLADAYNQIYDPTNGTVSAGGIIRYFGEVEGFKIP